MYNRRDQCNVLSDQVPEESQSCGEFKDTKRIFFFSSLMNYHLLRSILRMTHSARFNKNLHKCKVCMLLSRGSKA